MSWHCPTCERKYPDSSIGVPESNIADAKEGCKVCWVCPQGTTRFIRPDSPELDNDQ